MSDKKDAKEQKINIELDDSTSQGIYSNLAVINHSPSEFVVDFVVIMPGNPKAKVAANSKATARLTYWPSGGGG